MNLFSFTGREPLAFCSWWACTGYPAKAFSNSCCSRNGTLEYGNEASAVSFGFAQSSRPSRDHLKILGESGVRAFKITCIYTNRINVIDIPATKLCAGPQRADMVCSALTYTRHRCWKSTPTTPWWQLKVRLLGSHRPTTFLRNLFHSHPFCQSKQLSCSGGCLLR